MSGVAKWVLLRGLALVALTIALPACLRNSPAPSVAQVCETTTPGFGGAPVPTSCHPRNVSAQRPAVSSPDFGSTDSQAKSGGGASTPRQRP